MPQATGSPASSKAAPSLHNLSNPHHDPNRHKHGLVPSCPPPAGMTLPPQKNERPTLQIPTYRPLAARGGAGLVSHGRNQHAAVVASHAKMYFLSLEAAAIKEQRVVKSGRGVREHGDVRGSNAGGR
jgi:hypothetical protein